LAQSSDELNKSAKDAKSDIFSYARKIKETTNGSRRRPRGQTRKTLEVFAQRGVEKDVRVDEQERTAQGGENKTQKPADK
jgi:hypothetical protein